MTAIRIATSIVLGLVATTSAFAAEPDNATVGTTAVTATTTTVAAAPRKVRYCVKSEVTGSRIGRVECADRSEWKQKGVDIDAVIGRTRR